MSVTLPRLLLVIRELPEIDAAISSVEALDLSMASGVGE